MMSELHAALVTNGDFEETEKLVEYFVNEGLFDAYLSRQDYKATWTQQTSSSDQRPGMRGGHQLIVDSNNSKMYLFGGWDGFEDLSDLWTYDINLKSWTLIHERAEHFDGPGPRSCHKMLFDPGSSQIFTLGRYLDGDRRTCRYIQVRKAIQKDYLLFGLHFHIPVDDFSTVPHFCHNRNRNINFIPFISYRVTFICMIRWPRRGF